jgi:5,10-methylenetetrahydromethanopterin reductase
MVNPVITAEAIASLDEIAPGRIVLGMGAGDKTTLEEVGVEMGKPLAAVRESIEIFRKLTAGEGLAFQGEVFKTAGAKFKFKPQNKIPVYIGAQGPKMLELACKIGDGVLVNASHPSDISYAVKMINPRHAAATNQQQRRRHRLCILSALAKTPRKPPKPPAPSSRSLLQAAQPKFWKATASAPQKQTNSRATLKTGNFQQHLAMVTPRNDQRL